MTVSAASVQKADLGWWTYNLPPLPGVGRSQVRCHGRSWPVVDFRSSSRSDLENERGQLIERVGKLQAHENEGYDHQIRAKMHEDLKTKVSS